MDKKKVKKSKEKGKEKEEKKEKKKVKARSKQGKAVRYAGGSGNLVVPGRPTIKPGPSPFLNSGLSTLPPLFQLPRNYGYSQQGIPSDPFAMQRINDPMNTTMANPPLSAEAKAQQERLQRRDEFVAAVDRMIADKDSKANAAKEAADRARDEQERRQRAMQSELEAQIEAILSGKVEQMVPPSGTMADESEPQAARASSTIEDAKQAQTESYQAAMNNPLVRPTEFSPSSSSSSSSSSTPTGPILNDGLSTDTRLVLAPDTTLAEIPDTRLLGKRKPVNPTKREQDTLLRIGYEGEEERHQDPKAEEFERPRTRERETKKSKLPALPPPLQAPQDSMDTTPPRT